jgi:predicted DNA-binding transcriptional regulator YafY
MPKNKDALIRYRVINKCFLERKYVSLRQLVSACEDALDIHPLSERTIEADIRAMRYDQGLGYNAPIKIDRARGVYYYEDPDFSIDNIPLNEAELDSLVFASRLLEQFKDIELFKTFNGSIQKLVEAVNVYRHSNYDDIRNFIEFEQVEFTKGTEHLEPLINAIRDRDVIRIRYRSFTSKRNTIHIIHPYHLKEYRNRWFLIGYCDKYSGIRTYGIDRILDIQVENGLRFKDVGFDAKKYFENVIGVSVLDDDPIEIHIAFSELQTQYILSQPLHKSQQFLSKGGNKFVYKYLLVPNYELVSQILGWGKEVEVLRPMSLRAKIHTITRKISRHSG